MRFWRFVSEYYLCSIGEVYKTAYPPGAISLEKKGIQIRERIIQREEAKAEAVRLKIEKLQARLEARKETVLGAKPGTKKRAEAEQSVFKLAAEIKELQSKLLSGPVGGDMEIPFPKSLTPVQEEALRQVEEAFGKGKPVLLQGVTGSGKTEIYIHLALSTLSAGRNILYLVPEIALSRQLEDRLRAVFGESLLVFHSAETPVRRREVADILRGDKPYVVLGTRSALFLPHRNLGLIIVDEEHDSSYKQDSPSPRYNGRDCSAVLAKLHECPLIMGSATPSLESLYNCDTGRYAKVELSDRYFGGDNPDIEIIDTIAERRKNGMVGSFSRKLIGRMEETLASGGQILLLRGRRAYSPSVQCENCGAIPKCPHCNVPMSYHRDAVRLVCHYCGYTEPYISCPECGGKLIPIGSGTQRIEEEARELFPSARIARLDSDTARIASYEENVIHDFASGQTDILIGTQMVSKGFDFEKLMLVAVIGADSLLAQQDFRADEKALQLLSQFGGRAGRRDRKGLFVIQSARPAHPVYGQIFSDKSIYPSMLAERRAFGYPPYSRLVCIVMKAKDPAVLDREGDELAGRLASAFGIARSFVPVKGKVSVTGPYAPAVDRIAGLYVRHIRITLPKDSALSGRKDIILAVTRDFMAKTRATATISIDVDPA